MIYKCFLNDKFKRTFFFVVEPPKMKRSSTEKYKGLLHLRVYMKFLFSFLSFCNLLDIKYKQNYFHMKILVTGNYEPLYNRTQILISGLKKNDNVNLVELPIDKNFTKQKFINEAIDADFIYLPPFTHSDVRFIKKLSSKPLIFDPLISKYLTKVFDYKQISRFSPRAIKNYFKDKFALDAADILLADTQAHKEYFCKKFVIKPEKIHVLPIGADCNVFYPTKNKISSSKFKVGFYGGFIPLQGTKLIIEAAGYLNSHKDIEFELIGNGFEFNEVLKIAEKNKLQNISFPGWIDYDKLNQKINSFDLCLGIFGATQKADLVIPNKIYHYAAAGKCIISKDTKAIKEIFTDSENVILIQNKPQILAEKILEIKNKPEFINKLSANARTLMIDNFDNTHISNRFLDILMKHS